MLAILYAFLVSFRRQDEVTRDMVATFEEARADAKAHGAISYTRFAIRELIGLAFARRPVKRRWMPVAAWGLGGLAVGLMVTSFRSPQYSSQASLSLAPPEIAERFYRRDPPLSVKHVVSAALPTVLSRTVLTQIINTYALYPNARAAQPIEAVIERMRRDIRIESQGENVILVAFTYGDSPWSSVNQDVPAGQVFGSSPDRYQALRVTQDLVVRMIDETIRNRNNQAYMTEQFFQDRSEKAATRWEKLNVAAQGLVPTDRRYERAVLDRDLARKEYESLRQKFSEAENTADLVGRGQSRDLELLDPASLPQVPDTSPLLIVLAGLAAGLFIGLLSAWLRTVRQKPARLLPSLAEG